MHNDGSGVLDMYSIGLDAELVRRAWFELRVACQFSEVWTKAEDKERMEQAKRGNTPEQSAEKPPKRARDLMGRAIERVEPEDWFYREELGLPCEKENIKLTLLTLEQGNKERAAKHVAMYDQLARARQAKVLKRTVTG